MSENRPSGIIHFILGAVFLLLLIFVAGLGSFILFCRLGLFCPMTIKSLEDSTPWVNRPITKKDIFSQPVSLEPSQETRALFFGDIMLDRNVAPVLQKNSWDYILGDLAGAQNKFFADWDLVSANLEGAVTAGAKHYAPEAVNDFAFSPESVGGLKDYNFNFFNLANNHITDQAQKGFTETETNLKRLGFNFSGCPDAQVGHCSSQTIDLQGQKVTMVGLSMVYHNFDLAAAQDKIKQAKKESDLVIVNIHWGTEYQHQFAAAQQKVAHSLIEAGADLIIGHHPHVVQGWELYQDKPIFYSLGNFIFDQYFSSDTQQGLAVGIDFSQNKISAIYLYPFVSQKNKLSLMSDQAQEKFLQDFATWSALDQSELIEQTKKGQIDPR